MTTTLPPLTFQPSTRMGECGLRTGLFSRKKSGSKDSIYFPRFLMGACGYDEAVVAYSIVNPYLPIPKIMNKEWFAEVSRSLNEGKAKYYDWDWHSFQQNIILPNREHIKMAMGIEDNIVDRICEDLPVVLNNWELDENDEEVKEMTEEGLTPLSHKTFFTHNDVEY
jgi:hypothetical protein